MRRCIIFIITLFVCFEGYSQNIIAGEEKIDYSGIDKMFSDMIKSENLLRLKCVTKDISWEYYREKTGQEISKLGDVGYYFKHIDRYYNSKYEYENEDYELDELLETCIDMGYDEDDILEMLDLGYTVKEIAEMICCYEDEI